MIAAAEPYEGLTVVIDTSALIKLPRAPASSRQEFASAMELGRIRLSPIVELEVLHGMRTLAEFQRRREFFDRLPKAELRRAVGPRAVHSMLELVSRPQSRARRIKWPDLLIAATAESRGFGVVHHDADFERIGEVVDCRPIWFADRDEARWASA